jgi:hypothetical protein
MATVKLSELPIATPPLDGTESVVMNQGGATVISPLSTIKTYTNDGITGAVSSVSGRTGVITLSSSDILDATDAGSLTSAGKVAKYASIPNPGQLYASSFKANSTGPVSVEYGGAIIAYSGGIPAKTTTVTVSTGEVNVGILIPPLAGIIPVIPSSTYAEDLSAAAAGVAVGELYFTGSKFRVRMS